MSRPEFITDEHLEYLDKLRESRKTSMFGAGRYVREEFGIDKTTALKITTYWMETFGHENR